MAFIHVLFLGLMTQAQQYNPGIKQKLDEISRSVELVRSFQDLGIKTAGSEASRNTVNWLVNEYKSYGYDSMRVDSFQRGGRWYKNVVVIKPGISKQVVLVCGHFDTRNGPGANDNGSGVAAILETARIMQDLNTTRTVMFVNFDGEEEGFIGSQHFVDNQMVAIQNDLYLVFNIDQIGGTYGVTGNDKIFCERDENTSPFSNNALSERITDSIANLARLYTSLTPVISKAFSSDYIPFEEKGIVISGLYQHANDKYSHRPTDTLGNMDTVSLKQAVRLTAAATIHFAQSLKYVNLKEVNSGVLRVYPNPTSDYLNVDLPNGNLLNVKVYNLLGEVMFSAKSSSSIAVTEWSNGMYIVELNLGNQGVYRQKILVQH